MRVRYLKCTVLIPLFSEYIMHTKLDDVHNSVCAILLTTEQMCGHYEIQTSRIYTDRATIWTAKLRPQPHVQLDGKIMCQQNELALDCRFHC